MKDLSAESMKDHKRAMASQNAIRVRRVLKSSSPPVLFTRRVDDISSGNLRSRSTESLRDTLRYSPRGEIRCYLARIVSQTNLHYGFEGRKTISPNRMTELTPD